MLIIKKYQKVLLKLILYGLLVIISLYNLRMTRNTCITNLSSKPSQAFDYFIRDFLL